VGNFRRRKTARRNGVTVSRFNQNLSFKLGWNEFKDALASFSSKLGPAIIVSKGRSIIFGLGSPSDFASPSL